MRFEVLPMYTLLYLSSSHLVFVLQTYHTHGSVSCTAVPAMLHSVA